VKKRIIISLVLLIGIIFGAFVYYKSATAHPFKGSEEIAVEVKEGYTFYNILEDLKNKNKVINPALIKLYVKLNSITPKIIPGEFNIPANSTIEEFVQILQNPDLNSNNINVTIPEGYTIEQIASTLEEKGIIKKDEFIKACKEFTLPDYISNSNEKRYNLEGFLFPDTYRLKPGMTGNEIINVMHKRFTEVINSIKKEKNIQIKNEDLEKIIIKASVIEREVTSKEEKSLVSSVIENRIKEGMKLQIDATVLYAKGVHKEVVLYSDLEIQSPYNTYYIYGLPVGAISNPGKDAIEAAIAPAQSDFLYYITKDNSKHEFFKTYEEFLNYKNQ